MDKTQVGRMVWSGYNMTQRKMEKALESIAVPPPPPAPTKQRRQVVMAALSAKVQ